MDEDDGLLSQGCGKALERCRYETVSTAAHIYDTSTGNASALYCTVAQCNIGGVTMQAVENAEPPGRGYNFWVDDLRLQRSLGLINSRCT